MNTHVMCGVMLAQHAASAVLPRRGPQRRRGRGVPGISHRLDGGIYRSCYSRLPPSLEELVDMRQTDAGGRVVLPREHRQHERRKSIGNCIM